MICSRSMAIETAARRRRPSSSSEKCFWLAANVNDWETLPGSLTACTWSSLSNVDSAEVGTVSIESRLPASTSAYAGCGSV